MTVLGERADGLRCRRSFSALRLADRRRTSYLDRDARSLAVVHRPFCRVDVVDTLVRRVREARPLLGAEHSLHGIEGRLNEVV